MNSYRPIGFIQQVNPNTEKYAAALTRFFNLACAASDRANNILEK